MADMSFCGAIAVISRASHLFRGTFSVGHNHLLGTQLLRVERKTAPRFFHDVPWSGAFGNPNRFMTFRMASSCFLLYPFAFFVYLSLVLISFVPL